MDFEKDTDYDLATKKFKLRMEAEESYSKAIGIIDLVMEIIGNKNTSMNDSVEYALWGAKTVLERGRECSEKLGQIKLEEFFRDLDADNMVLPENANPGVDRADRERADKPVIKAVAGKKRTAKAKTTKKKPARKSSRRPVVIDEWDEC